MSTDPLIGRAISHFRVVSRLGEGAMGVVYRATDRALWRDVALKVLPPHVAEDGERRLRFFHEARAAAAVGHTNIATIHEVGMDGGVIFIAMELVEGPSLRAALDAGLDATARLSIAVGLARGLARAHERGVLHRDLKPENVVLDRDGTPKILDFGLARALGPIALGEVIDPTFSGTLKGTLGYLSPEQARGEPLDARSDVYALGLVLFELLTGARAVPEGPAIPMLLAATEGRVPSLAGRVAPALAEVVHRCCALRPEDRHPNAGAVRDALVAATRRAGEVAEVAADAIVGRIDEVRAVRARIESNVPLLAVTGPPGVGTSTVVRTALAETLSNDPRPAAVVRVGEGADVTRTVDAIERALGAPMGAQDDPIRSLAAALRSRSRWLVVLDDLAHVTPEVVRAIQGALSGVPGAQVVLVAESAPDVPGVPIAGIDAASAPLLLGAGRSAVPVAILAATARLLDRHPFALRLVAPHVGSVDGAADMLATVAEELAPSPRPARLDRAVDWSVRSLEAPVRELLTSVSTFVAPFDLAAAEAVGGADPRASLDALVARGLVRREGERWLVPRAVRRRIGAAIAARALHAHAAWLAGLARAALDAVLEGRDRDPLDALEAALPEALALLDRAEHADAELVDAAAVALAGLVRVLHLAGRVGAVAALAARALARDRASPGPRCDLLVALGTTSVERAPAEVRNWAQEAATLAHASGDARRLSLALGTLARAALLLGHPHEAAAAADDAIRAARSTRVPALVERALADAGRAYSRTGRMPDALAAAEEALASARARGAVRVLPELYVLSGYLHTLVGEADQSAAFENAAVESARREAVDDILGVAVLNRGAGRLAAGRHAEARRDLLEAIACLERRDEPVRLATALGNLGVVDWESGHHAGALNLLDRSIQLLTQCGERRARSLMEAARASLLAQLGDLAAADAGFATARELCPTGEPAVVATITVLRHHLDLARARATTDESERATLVARVLAAIGGVNPPDGPGRSLGQTSDMVRTATRTLDMVLQADARTRSAAGVT